MYALTQPPLLLLFLFLFLLSFSIYTRCLSDPRATELRLVCGDTQLAPSHMIPIFTQAMNYLSRTFPTQNFVTYSLNNITPPIYTLGQCHDDLSHTDCLLCYSAGCTKLASCLPSSSARIYQDGCFLRYDNYSFFNEYIDHARDAVNCSVDSAESIVSSNDMQDNSTKFTSKVGAVLEDVMEIALVNDGFFGVAEKDGVFALAQCWKSLGFEGCRTCLEKANDGLKGCGVKKEGKAMNTGCFVRYSTTKFYNDGDHDDADDNGLSRAGILSAVILSALALLGIALLAAYGIYVKLSKVKIERKNLGKVSFSFNKSSLMFKYETLEKATDYFGPSRKLGEGGNGSVYKGILSSGEIVAVKRLIFNTRQWVDEFFNEVNLISGIEHKNLVKLLGCSIEGPESLLVYEYVPNKSLDENIFDHNKVQILSWTQRFNIIFGTAEGLAYLHGGSQVRIIHRDIKGSNVLLDENLAPKIADFGLVRCFGTDKSHLSTGIAGTLGYMAPEYLVKGQLTEKADVYSFGVLVLEIVCGRRNNSSVQDSGSLLQAVWKLYRTDKLPEAVDPCLNNDFPAEKASHCLRIGLLCTQASAASRPSMAQVVKMLGNEGSEIPMPKQPPFLDSSVLTSGSSRSFSTGNLVSTTGTQNAVFDTSSESRTVHS